MNERVKQLNEELQSYGGLREIEKPLVAAELLLGNVSPRARQIIQTSKILNTASPALGKTPLRYFEEFLRENFSGYQGDLLSELYGGAYSDGHNLGIVLTPEHITELCCELLDLHAGDTLFEPCCGTGRFLVSAMKYVGDQVYGVEVQEDLSSIARANVRLHGEQAEHVIFGDIFTEDIGGEHFTAGYMNPPYSQKITELEFTMRLLSQLKTGGRAAVIVPVSVMIGKTKADKERKREILSRHTLEGVITLNKDTFYGVGTVPCIAVFTVRIPQPKGKQSKFINFQDDGYEVKKHVGLVSTEKASERREYLLDCWRGKRTDYRTKFMVKSRVEADDEWLHSFYYYNDELPTEADFERTMAEYLAFEANMIFHGRGYLFKGGESDAERADKDSEPRGRRTPEGRQADEEEPQQYRIVFDD